VGESDTHTTSHTLTSSIGVVGSVGWADGAPASSIWLQKLGSLGYVASSELEVLPSLAKLLEKEPSSTELLSVPI
jgi:hypothetical protein